MPNFTRGKDDIKDDKDDLEIASRVMDTVGRQIASYRMSLEKLRGLRKEILLDEELEKRITSSPEAMTKVLTERGIPEVLAVGMAAEDFQDPNYLPNLAIWTWNCCCTACCITCIIHTSKNK
jgi:hypothetical protein